MRNYLIVYSLHSYLDASELNNSDCSPAPTPSSSPISSLPDYPVNRRNLQAIFTLPQLLRCLHQ